MYNKKIEKTFWVTNISNKNVSLSDLNMTIRAHSLVNLLDKRHYKFTEEQLEKSITSGSLFSKRDKIVKRLVEPEIVDGIVQSFFSKIPSIIGHKVEQDNQASIPTRQRSVLKIEIKEYEELKMSLDNSKDALEAEFEAIAETADLSLYDRQPPIKKD